MIATRITLVVGLLLYCFLWVIALNGASNLIVLLAIPLILAVLVWAGLWLDRYLGITPRKQHFRDRDDETKS